MLIKKTYAGKTGKTKWIAIMTNFGLSFLVKLYLIGVLLGGWLDRHLTGGKGYLVILMVFVTIVYSIYMLYQDLIKLEKQEKAETETTTRDGDDLE